MALDWIPRGKLTLDVWRARGASRAAIETRQHRRLEQLLSFARRHSRFYKRHYAEVPEGSTDLRQYPPVTKSMLMEHFDDVVTDTAITRAEIDEFVAEESTIGQRFLDRYPVWTTSGTTGEPGIFVQDDTTLTLIDILPDRWILPGLLEPTALQRLVRNGIRVAEIAVTGGHFAGASGIALLQRESRFFQNRVQLFSPMRPLSELIAELNRYQPTFLNGYATVLVELARAQQAGKLDIGPAFIAPTAEPISDAQKRDLRETFECTVRELYGATECFPIAVECERGNLHANTDWVVLEPVDTAYQPVEPGEPAETVLITNLGNRIQPLVRYDLGDTITMYEEPCPCDSAFPVIEIEGRQGDVLHFESAEGTRVPVFPLALSSVVEAVAGVHRAQIIQPAPQTLTIRLDVAEETDEQTVWNRVERDVETFLDERGITDIRIESSQETPQRDSGSGKFRHVWSEVDS